ncbi:MULTISPECIES: DNA modification system-associated small protein [unclassified Caballeronia]|uniref:DNA modification system-associated small protein n=1 Tax=unclassified Caballeronia TaxID=2646786 RepID=UPI002865F5C0|nr:MULTISPECIES: DNA modification system-associated small protein [unclassified Caballeronia]MDR5812317.1 hypothetical protein [Caballeronia sp. LZ033]MDR5819142.1 hypothetical protein [Caballeronia sp. LZ043]
MERTEMERHLSDLPLWADEDAMQVLSEVGSKYGIETDVLAELVVLQRERQHQERAHGINARIEEILGRVTEA